MGKGDVKQLGKWILPIIPHKCYEKKTMKNRAASFAVLFLFILCAGCGGSPLGPSDDLLAGQWSAVGLDSNGDRVILNFSPSQGKRKATIQVILPTGTTVPVASGNYSIENGNLRFRLDNISEFSSPFTVTQSQLTLGTDVYTKFSPTPTGGTLAGQIQISDPTLSQSPTLAVPGAPPLLHVQSLSSPNDPLLSQQWNLEVLNITDAWGVVSSTQAVVVAVVDTGIVQNHPDLSGRVLNSGYDFVSQSIPGVANLSLDGDGPDSDPTDPGDGRNLGLPGGSSWHGTHLSGIIAAATDNATGIAGVGTANVKILPLRAVGSGGNGTIYDVAQAIYYAAKLPNIADCNFTTTSNGGQTVYAVNTSTCRLTSSSYTSRPKANVINLSLGAPFTDPKDAQYLNDAIDAAYRAGVVIVAASGNEKMSTANYFPAANSSVLSIGAVYPNLAFAGSYSNFGSASNNSQFLVAPGGSSTSAVLSTVSPQVLGGYGTLMGTSQASAHVSAVAAMTMAENSSLTPAQVKTMLQTTAIDLGSADLDVKYGWGLLNPCGALLAAEGKTGSGSSTLKLSASSVNFKSFENLLTVLVTSGCGGPAISGLSVTPQTTGGGSWLTATLNTSTTPAQLSLSVSRSALPQGTYTGSVAINSPSGNSSITVSMDVTASSNTSSSTNVDDLTKAIENYLASKGGTAGSFKNTLDIGTVTVLLVDTATNSVVGKSTDIKTNYGFQFVAVPPGNYKVVAGIDADGDGQLCSQGSSEPCFGYPNSTNVGIISVSATTNRNDLVLTE